MSLSSDLLNVFSELDGSLLKNINLDNLPLVDFSRILNWISLQFQFFAKTDSIINIIKDDSDLESLKIELSSLLNELGSIHTSESLNTIDQVSERQLILHSLAGDLIASRINYVKKIDENLDVFSNNLNPKNDLKIINNCLSITSDLKNVREYFQTVKQKLDKSLLKFHEEDSLLLPNSQKLTSKQWEELKRLNDKLANEFSIRREMLLRRADMTVSSFSWNEDKTRKEDEQTIKNIYNEKRKAWSTTPMVTLSHALASRSSDCDSLINKRISINHASCYIDKPNIGKANTGLQQRLQLHKFLIGSVPDRGGRPFEQPPPPKETFAQQQSQRDRGGRGGGHRGGGGGGDNRQRHQNQQNYQQQNYHQNRDYQQQQQQHQNYRGGRDYHSDDNFGSRIQNAGWQQQGQVYQHYQQDNYYQQEDNYRHHHKGDRGGGNNYHRGGGNHYRGGNRGGGNRGRSRDYYY